MAAVAPKAGRDRKAELFEQVLALFPSIETKWNIPAGRLSGGQQQMVAIARALLCDPELLVVDEMTLGLHHSLQEPLFEAMHTIAARGTGVLLVEESTGLTLEMADYCYLVSSGVISDEGPPSRFRGNELLAAGYVGEG
jgi:branched-chain amino acid transport system ATP-binding protein